MNRKELLKMISTKESRQNLEDKLISLLAKHLAEDLTFIDAVTMLEFFRIGRIEVENAPTETLQEDR